MWINKRRLSRDFGYTIGFTENTSLWSDLLEDLKNRGLKAVDIVVMDGAKGVPQTVKQHFPNSDIQICTVHTMRNLMNKVAVKDKEQIIPQIKSLFLLSNIELIGKQIEELKIRYSKYDKLFDSILEKDYIFTYLKYPTCIHKAIKSTNGIEAINQKIKTRVSHKKVFPSVEVFEKILEVTIIELNNSFGRKVNEMKAYLKQIK